MRAATIFKLNRNLRYILCGRPVWNAASVRLISVKAPVADAIQPQKKKPLSNGPGFKEFLVAGKNIPAQTSPENVPYLSTLDYNGHGRKVFFEVYGCQMNVNDTEIVWAILKENDYEKAKNIEEANVVLVVTCAIREGAEDRIWHRLRNLASIKKKKIKKGEIFQVGVLGCMAERLKTQLLEKEQSVDIVSGPDSYKDLPRLLAITQTGQSAVNVLLSLDETYADIMPVRLNEGARTAFVSIMRGCDNMCSYCIVPFTRGRERSRPIDSIEGESRLLQEQGIKEITLLGQNVNSYRDLSTDPERSKLVSLTPGFKTVYKPKIGGMRFAELLQRVAEAVPEVRIRFTSPHPKDFPDDVLRVMAQHPNICKNIHLPAQSGNSDVLERMRRGYTRETYLELVDRIRDMMPKIGLSSDFICGFCGETDDEFQDTLTLMERVRYNVAYLFAYSMREKTTAHRRYKDDVPAEVKSARVRAMSAVYRAGAEEVNQQYVGREELILIEAPSKKSTSEFYGRIDSNIKVIVPHVPIPLNRFNYVEGRTDGQKRFEPGDFIVAKIIETNSQTMKGIPLYHSSITEHHAAQSL